MSQFSGQQCKCLPKFNAALKAVFCALLSIESNVEGCRQVKLLCTLLYMRITVELTLLSILVNRGTGHIARLFDGRDLYACH